MSRENVELVQALFEASGGGTANLAEFTAKPEMMRPLVEQFYSPDVEVTWDQGSIETRTYRGHDGMIQTLGEWIDAFSEFYVEPLEFIEAGEQVIVRNRQRGIGKGSGVETSEEFFWVFTLAGDKVARLREFHSLEEAEQAANPRSS
jgi:ketosteroid isomerase-like protein